MRDNEVTLAYAYVALYNLLYRYNVDVVDVGKGDFMNMFKSEIFYCFDIYDEDMILDVYEKVLSKVNETR